MIDALMEASIEGRQLNVPEVVANGALLVAAGLETTSNALSSAY